MLEGMKLIGAGAATIALAGAAIGIGNVFSSLSLIESVTINPSLAKQLFGYAILGVPLALAPFLVLLELISYCFRALSLGIRLFANMMASHSLVLAWDGKLYMLPDLNLPPEPEAEQIEEPNVQEEPGTALTHPVRCILRT